MFLYKANFAGESGLAVDIEMSLRYCLWFSILNQANVCYSASDEAAVWLHLQGIVSAAIIKQADQYLTFL